MAFCTNGTYNSVVTASLPKKIVTQFKHWLGMISDEEYAKWLNEPDQKKLWEQCTYNPSDNIQTGPGVPNEQPKRAAAPLNYHPEVCELPPEMMFMHDAVFAEDDKVDDISLNFPEDRSNIWDEIEADRTISSRGSHTKRAQQYLDESKKVEYAAY